MVTEQVEESLEDKSPITRGSESHQRTFEIKALDEEGGIKSYITSIEIQEQYSPMHYDLKWSTSGDRDVPFVGTPIPEKEKITSTGEDNPQRGVPATPKPAHHIAVVFRTASDDYYHMRWGLGHLNLEKEDLLTTLICDIGGENISEENPVEAMYEPTSDSGGDLKVGFMGNKVGGSRRAFEGQPDEEYTQSEETLDLVNSWIQYILNVRNGEEWVECPVLNAYESEDGEEVSILVETPVGDTTVFEFNVTPDKSSPYWTLLQELAQGDPANLSDSENTVYLKHRSRSFYDLTVSEHRDVIRGRYDSVLNVGVNCEWELRTDKPTRIPDISSSISNSDGILSRIKSKIKYRVSF